MFDKIEFLVICINTINHFAKTIPVVNLIVHLNEQKSGEYSLDLYQDDKILTSFDPHIPHWKRTLFERLRDKLNFYLNILSGVN